MNFWNLKTPYRKTHSKQKWNNNYQNNYQMNFWNLEKHNIRANMGVSITSVLLILIIIPEIVKLINKFKNQKKMFSMIMMIN